MNICDLPIEVQEIIHQRQREQGNTGNFKGLLGTTKENGNFNWYETPEYDSYWWKLMYQEPVKDNIYYINLKNELFKPKSL